MRLRVVRSCLLFFLVAHLPTSCARSVLRVEVDLYGGDPHAELLRDPGEAARLAAAVRSAADEARSIARLRIEAAELLVAFYRTYLEAVASRVPRAGAAKLPDAALDPVLRAEEEYARRVQALAERIELLAKRAEAALAQWTAESRKERVPSPRRETGAAAEMGGAYYALLDALEPLRAALERMSSPLDTAFEELAEGAVEEIRSDAPNLFSGAEEEELEERFRALEGTLLERGFALEDERMENERLLLALARGPGPGARGRQVLETLEAAVHPAARLDLYTSQIDRLQDPADPAWRIVADPGREDRWIPCLARSEFYAEGDAAVVFVQDRLGHFRVQRGVNDPRALVRGQLRVSRALASGALDLLAAAAGVSGAPGLAGVAGRLRSEGVAGNDPPAQSLPAVRSGEECSGVSLESRVEALRAVRRRLLSELRVLRSELVRLEPEGEVGAEWAARVRALFETFAVLLREAAGGGEDRS